MQKIRLLNSSQNTTSMNMAIDEALLDSKRPVLRFYQWKPAGISIGYSQEMRKEIDVEECKKRGIGYVRRLTGGKAVLHDAELTYSIILDANAMPKGVIESYKIIAKGIILGFERLGIKAEMKESVEKKIASSICFNEPSYYEIVVDGKKIVGSAQVRKKGKILQHGSVLIEVDAEKLCSLFNNINKKIIEITRNRITSINNVLNRKVSFEEVAEAMNFGFRKNFKAELLPDELTEEELDLAKRLSLEKYSSDQWNFMR